MRSSILGLAASLFALAVAQDKPNPFTIPPSFMVNAGQPTSVTWTPTTGGTVTIYLRSGASNNLDKGIAVASNVQNNGKTNIDVPADTVRNSDYALSIVSDQNPGEINYSAPFVVESKNTVESQSSQASSASMTSSSAASTSAAASTNSAAMTTKTSSMSTSGASTKSTMSTMSAKTSSSSKTQSTGSSTSGSSMTSSSSGSTATGASTTKAPSSDAISLKVGGLLLVALIGAVAAW
ncbi:MAG: hypothetical protein Q9212_001401 [Teloschistes hypoglaucus]